MKEITTVRELLEALVLFAGDIQLAHPVQLTLCTHRYRRSGIYTDPLAAGEVIDQADLEEAIDDPLEKLDEPVLSIAIEYPPVLRNDEGAEE